MQGQKRTTRSERHYQDGIESGGNSMATGKRNPSVRGDNDVDEADDAGNIGANGGVHVNTSSNASYRLLDGATAVDQQVVYRNLWLFIWLKVIGSFDSGAFSAALGSTTGIGNSWDLKLAQQGLLTSSVFLGNVIGCPLAGHLFSRFNEKRVLCGSLVIHTVFTFLFAAMPSFDVALVNRFFIGLSLAFIVVYTPVWVDEFAPKNRQSVWMASHNAGVPLGIMFGYLMAVAPEMVFPSIGWNWAFFLKCLLMIPTIAYVARVDARTINAAKVAGEDEKGDDVENNNDAGAGEGQAPVSRADAVVARMQTALNTAREGASRALATPIGEAPRAIISASGSLLVKVRYVVVGFYSTMFPLLSNLVYVCSVVSLTSLYFVATGLQNFVTQYLQESPFNASMATIMLGFSSAVVTAPVCGVIAGGILLDRIGGYKRNLRRVTFFLFAWGGCAVFFSVLCIFATTTRAFLLLMSVVLFCGGALIPPGAGLTMASLPDHLRSAGAAFSQTVYNLLGNFSGPLVCGWVAEATGQLRYGIIVLLLSSSLGVLPLFGILVVACRDGPLPNGLGQAASGADGASGAEGLAVEEEEEEAEEMASVDGEAAVAAIGGVEKPPMAMMEAEPAVAPPPPARSSPQPQSQTQQPQRSRPHEKKKSQPPAPNVREVSTFEGTASSAASPSTHAAPPAALPGPQNPSPASVASVESNAASPASQHPSPAQQQKQPSPLADAVRTWSSSRPAIQGPGTAHPVLVPAGATRPTPSQNTPEALPATVAAPRAAATHGRGEPHMTDLELLKLESEAAQVLSVPNEQAYGMDLVRSWLSTQQQNVNAEGANGAVSGN